MLKFQSSRTMLSSGPDVSSEIIKAVIERDKLVGALAAVNAAQTDGDVGWIQLHFVGNGDVVLSAVSHSLSIKYDFRAEYTGQGIVRVSGRQLSEYVRQLPPEKITLIAELPQKLTLKCGRSSARMQLVQDQTHSEVHVPDIGTILVAKGNMIERWVNSFKDFVLLEDNRYYATGAYIWADNDDGLSLHAVASDAFRLAKAQLTEGIRAERLDSGPVLVPKKTLDELRRICAQEPGRDFVIKWHKESLFFAVDAENYTLISKCIAGEYPPYTSAIPQSINLEIQVEQKALAESVKRVLLFADKNKTIKLQFDGTILDVQSFTPGIKEGEEQIELEKAVEKPFEVNYNGTLLTGILNVLSGTKIYFAWEDVSRPVKVTGDLERGLNVFYLLVSTRF